MTKAELIKFLEPFTDDIRILDYRGLHGQFDDARPEYRTASDSMVENNPHLKLEKYEGVVII